MKDFHQFKRHLLEARMPRSTNAQIKYLDQLWAAVSSDFRKVGRNGTDFSLHDTEVKPFVTKDLQIDWKKMAKENKSLFDWAFEELYYYYED